MRGLICSSILGAALMLFSQGVGVSTETSMLILAIVIAGGCASIKSNSD